MNHTTIDHYQVHMTLMTLRRSRSLSQRHWVS